MPHPMQHTAPDGWTYVDFHGGSLDGQYRLVKGEPAHGDTYEVITTREGWRYEDGAYRLWATPR